jgi:hypothetical protein
MTPSAAPPVRTTGNVLSLGASVAVVFVVFDRSAAAFRSFRGEAGLLVCAIVLVALFVVSWRLYREPTGVTVRRMGFGRLATVIQRAIKVVAVPSTSGMALPLTWMAASALLPWLVFLVPKPADEPRSPTL